MPWRVSSSGPVFRYENAPGAGRLREFTQVGVELIGAPGPAADAEAIGLADQSLANTGIRDVTIRIGHVGLILEILGHAGLPRSASSALVEMLSAAAADGKGIQTIESALERLAGWLESGGEAEAIVPAVSHADEPGVDRLFRHLVPNVTGRRSGHEIINRLRSKWELDRTLWQILARVREQFHGLAELRGPAPTVLERLDQNFASLAPRSIADLGALVKELAHQGVEANRVELDLGFRRGIGFYSQMIFELVVETAAGPVEVCGGGRYDGLARVLGSNRDDRGVGFAFGLERLMEVCAGRAARPNTTVERVVRLEMTTGPIDPIRLAIPSKGHLYDGIIELLKTAGYKVRRASDRQYEATIVGHPRFHVVFMRPTDIVIQVQEGRCHLGVTGMDVFAEHAVETDVAAVISSDLGYGGCRLAVAVPESWIDVSHIMDLVDLTTEFKSAGRTFRVSTKYPALVRQYFRKFGIYYYQMIDSEGALELHPSLGIADIIVDLTSSGTTLKDNRLREIEGGTVLESASCLIGHGPSLATLLAEGEDGPLAHLLDAIDGVRGAEGWLHVEVVGSQASPGPATAALVATHLQEHGASHIVRGEVWDDRGSAGWRVTALLSARKLTTCRRALFRLGASRVVGLAPRIVFDRDGTSTFDKLCQQLTAGGPGPESGGRDE